MPQTFPSRVRSLVLRSHFEVQQELDRVRAVLSETECKGRTCADEAYVRLAELTRQLFEHMADLLDLEDELLLPALREADAWGEVRSEELVRLHEQQWQALKGLRGRATECRALCDALQEIAQLSRALYGELLVEDRDLLAPDVLRDDVLGIDVEGG